MFKSIGRPAGAQRPNLILSAMTAVNDFLPGMGGTPVIPGSHKWDAERQAEAHEVVSIVMPAGAMVYWLGGILRGAGANTTSDLWREGIFLSWGVGWLRQEENQYLNVPFE